MSTKQEILRMIQGLPENVTIEDIVEELHVRLKLEKGLRELDKGKTIPHDMVKEQFGKWLT